MMCDAKQDIIDIMLQDEPDVECEGCGRVVPFMKTAWDLEEDRLVCLECYEPKEVSE